MAVTIIGLLAVSWPWTAAISAGIFAAVFLGIYAIFSQPGRVQLSPQREAALASGHNDRSSLFESPLARPALWVCLVLAHRLAMPRAKHWLRRTLVAAGSPKFYTPEEYLALCLFAAFVAGAVLELFYLVAAGQFGGIAFGLGAFGGLFAGLYGLYDKARTRVRSIQRRIPYALDLISLAMGAGASFVEAVRAVTGEGEDDALDVELRAMLAEMDLGTGRDAALQNLADRVPLESLRTIVASVIQGERLGTPLGQVLHDQASLLRLHRSTRAEELAARATVRILLPCLLLLMAVVLAMFGPAILRMARGGLF
jgi:tight adherence protein C